MDKLSRLRQKEIIRHNYNMAFQYKDIDPEYATKCQLQAQKLERELNEK